MIVVTIRESDYPFQSIYFGIYYLKNLYVSGSVSWCSILLKPHLVEQVIIDISQKKVGQIILKKCKIVFRVQMLFKKVWIYDVIPKNTCPKVNRPLSLKFLVSLALRVLMGIIMSINASFITEHEMSIIRKEHLCDKMWVSLNLIQGPVTKLQASVKIPRF